MKVLAVVSLMQQSKSQPDQRGFTVPELVVASTVILLLLLTSLLLLRTRSFDVQNRNSQRRLDLIQLVKGLQLYKQSTGKYPETLPSKATAIGSGDDMYDLCPLLVPTYMQDMPIDPVTGQKVDFLADKETNDACNVPGVDYMTGYLVHINANGTVTVGLELPESQMISLTTND